MNPHSSPHSLRDLFFSFTLIALQGFGGVVAIIQRELVEKKQWMTKEEFVEAWSVAQIMPGPNVVNLSLVLGARYFGVRGACVAVAGLLCVPILIVLASGMLYTAFSNHPGVAGAMRGMSAVAAGLIIATGIKLFEGLESNSLGKIRCIILGVLCFVFIALLRWPLLGVLLMLGPIACFLAYRSRP
jgi:chromate transporter